MKQLVYGLLALGAIASLTFLGNPLIATDEGIISNSVSPEPELNDQEIDEVITEESKEVPAETQVEEEVSAELSFSDVPTVTSEASESAEVEDWLKTLTEKEAKLFRKVRQRRRQKRESEGKRVPTLDKEKAVRLLKKLKEKQEKKAKKLQEQAMSKTVELPPR